ncbi:hypothetical protein EVAR_12780_1 [Eumeta japonica]|uniref:Uncharacterized protein n=1 Tax=Eumeta variegata TaxID=151549 RepID=A0A4C1UBI4_EUMVA|nr:hypothetical protein EVAR_12780_1 [Eumeta japonica]
MSTGVLFSEDDTAHYVNRDPMSACIMQEPVIYHYDALTTSLMSQKMCTPELNTYICKSVPQRPAFSPYFHSAAREQYLRSAGKQVFMMSPAHIPAAPRLSVVYDL